MRLIRFVNFNRFLVNFVTRFFTNYNNILRDAKSSTKCFTRFVVNSASVCVVVFLRFLLHNSLLFHSFLRVSLVLFTTPHSSFDNEFLLTISTLFCFLHKFLVVFVLQEQIFLHTICAFVLRFVRSVNVSVCFVLLDLYKQLILQKLNSLLLRNFFFPSLTTTSDVNESNLNYITQFAPKESLLDNFFVLLQYICVFFAFYFPASREK